MDALAPDANLSRQIETPAPTRRRRRANPLTAALRNIPATERQAAIATSLAEVEDEERRADLLARVQGLSSEQLAGLLAGVPAA